VTTGRPRTTSRTGCLLRVAAVVAVAVAAMFVVGAFCAGSGDDGGAATTYDAGPASAYEDASVTAVEPQHLLIVRLPGGEFRVFRDISPRQQELGGDCRVVYDETAGTGTLPQIEGMAGALVEDCNNSRAVWRLDGRFAFGNGYGDLDRYDTRTDGAGHLIVDLDSRTCTRSRGVIGVAPFDVKRCDAGQ
jgi:hypothetical protein